MLNILVVVGITVTVTANYYYSSCKMPVVIFTFIIFTSYSTVYIFHDDFVITERFIFFVCLFLFYVFCYRRRHFFFSLLLCYTTNYTWMPPLTCSYGLVASVVSYAIFTLCANPPTESFEMHDAICSRFVCLFC